MIIVIYFIYLYTLCDPSVADEMLLLPALLHILSSDEGVLFSVQKGTLSCANPLLSPPVLEVGNTPPVNDSVMYSPGSHQCVALHLQCFSSSYFYKISFCSRGWHMAFSLAHRCRSSPTHHHDPDWSLTEWSASYMCPSTLDKTTLGWYKFITSVMAPIILIGHESQPRISWVAQEKFTSLSVTGPMQIDRYTDKEVWPFCGAIQFCGLVWRQCSCSGCQ